MRFVESRDILPKFLCFYAYCCLSFIAQLRTFFGVAGIFAPLSKIAKADTKTISRSSALPVPTTEHTKSHSSSMSGSRTTSQTTSRTNSRSVSPTPIADVEEAEMAEKFEVRIPPSPLLMFPCYRAIVQKCGL